MHSHAKVTATSNTLHVANSLRTQFDHFWVLALLLVGFALRLFQFAAESLWYDETVSVYLATLPLTQLIAHTARDIHPPAYYLLLDLWQHLANPSVAFGLEYLYAWPSLCLSMLVMVLTYAIAKRCFGSVAARWALALALFHPVQIWFAQEVRMYALGAFCLLLTLWAISPLLIVEKQSTQRQILPTQSLILYPIAALLGLYTLYYFLFWLVVLNLCIVVRLWRNGHATRNWVALQLLVLIGWLAWLPIFFRQALTPPVPAWRVPWQNATEMLQALSEGIAALWIGHTPPFTLNWPWAILVLVALFVFVGYAKKSDIHLRLLWLCLCAGPLLLLLGVSVLATPIYHVRYVATYAPLFVLLLAAVFTNLRRLPALTLFIAIALLSASSLQQLWTNPSYAADDHRAAVATLARQWRPGDAILVNAGWVYTALSVYWPTELSAPDASRPPALSDIVRLADLNSTHGSPAHNGPLLVRTGSVDGESSLGWGLPESDFFALSGQETTAALTYLASTHPNIWHYRLYDTVSDPNGLIRKWLESNAEPTFSQAIPGRDFLRLEGYRTAPLAGELNSSTPSSPSAAIEFPDAAVTLHAQSYPQHLPAGEMLYVDLNWQSIVLSATTTTPALSLRLYNAQGQFLLQSDSPILLNPSGASVQSLALPIPADTIPGVYTLSLIVYDPNTLIPYVAIANDGIPIQSPIELGKIEIQLPTTIPHTPTPLATFDYIDLLHVELPTTPLAPNATLNSAWTWRPQPRSYRDHYIAHLELSNTESLRIPLLDFNLGGDEYSSSTWPAEFPLTQHIATFVPATLPSGTYRVQLSLTRASDGQPMTARLPWQPWQQPTVDVGELQIVGGD